MILTAGRAPQMSDCVLSIDCGTQSLRALVFNAQGELLARRKIEYEPYFSVQPGWAEQDPEIWWQALLSAVRGLLEAAPEMEKRIVGLALTTQRDSMICVDQNGRVVRPATLWLDSRKAVPPWRPDPFTGLALGLVGMSEAVVKTQEAGRCSWLMQNEPDNWQRTYKYVQVSGFLTARLTGEYRDSVASQIGHLPFDYKHQRWATARQRNAKMFPVDPAKLPELVPAGQELGRLTNEAAAACGLPAGLPVFAAGSDKGCETLGMGVLDESTASLSFGTTATIQTTSRRYLEPLRFMPSYPAALPGHWNPEVEIFRGYWMITWFKNQFAYQEVLEANAKNIVPEMALNQLLESTPPGGHGLVMQPYWTAGLKHPAAKGAIIGFGDVHERAHLYRAIIEGLAFGLKDGLHSIQKVSRKQIHELAVSGGASQSDQICQISADIFNLPLYRGATYETSGLGAAMCAAAGLGWYASVEDAARAMSRRSTCFEPRREPAVLYKQLYTRVYSKMYKALSPLYEEIREITNYPEKPGRITK
ncbi:MAG: FGGY-family carbohydrate kinase [Spirochaetes bacterium]|nr:FGGY-family carbohydrate kinase [Spirochaetota bacterium]